METVLSMTMTKYLCPIPTNSPGNVWVRVDFHWKDLTLSFLFKGSAKVDYYRSGLGNDAGWIPFYNGELGNVIKLANNPKNRWTPAWYS